MVSKSLSYKVLVLFLATVIFNQLACSKASFQADESTKAQRSPQPDNVDDPFNTFNDTDVVRCDNTNAAFCDRGDDGLTDDVPVLTYTPPRCDITSETGNCYRNTYADTRRNPINGVDVWLVVDSSQSFDAARVAVGQAVTDHFVAAMVRDGVEVRVSVIAGHAPSGSYAGVRSAAPYTNSGIFYQHTTEPLTIVIRNQSEIASKRAQLLSKLDSYMRESPISIAKRASGSIEVTRGNYQTWNWGGPHSGSDELGLLNFYHAMTGPNKATIPANNGWVVMFLSDENDACVPFSNYSSRSPYFDTITGKYYSHQGGELDYKSDEAEMFDWYCNGLTTSQVYAEAVRFAGDRPYAIGAMVYRNRSTIPSNAHAQADIGQGYLELVAKAGRQGATVDLATASSSNLEAIATSMVSEMAEITNESVGTHTQYPIYDSANRRLSLNSVETVNGTFNMQVYVDGRRSNYTIDATNSLVRPSTLGSEVEIRFCLK